MHRAALSLLCASIGAAFAAGCSLLLNYDGASKDFGAAGDAAADDEASSDAGAPLADSEPEARYPPGSWCAGQDPTIFLCDDFDDGPLGARWTATTFPLPDAATFSPVASSLP